MRPRGLQRSLQLATPRGGVVVAIDGQEPSGVSSQAFKPVPGGWIYRAPNPWVFGDAPHYLVNDAQKMEIEAIVAPRRPALVGITLIIGMVGWLVAVTNLIGDFGSGGDNPTISDLFAMIVLMAVPPLIGVPLSAWIQRRRVAPVLSNLLLTGP